MTPPITGSSTFHEWEAAHGAGLSLWQWERGEYPEDFKARVCVWWRAHTLVGLHTQDAASKPRRKGR